MCFSSPLLPQIRDPQIKPFCLFSSPESKKKANMITVVALYFVSFNQHDNKGQADRLQLIVHDHTPSEAFAPVAHLEMRPFRDAGNGPMDYGLGLQVGISFRQLDAFAKLITGAGHLVRLPQGNRAPAVGA